MVHFPISRHNWTYFCLVARHFELRNAQGYFRPFVNTPRQFTFLESKDKDRVVLRANGDENQPSTCERHRGREETVSFVGPTCTFNTWLNLAFRYHDPSAQLGNCNKNSHAGPGGVVCWMYGSDCDSGWCDLWKSFIPNQRFIIDWDQRLDVRKAFLH